MELGQCFNNSYEALTPKHNYLVHGVVVGTGGAVLGKAYIHAWIEYMDKGLPICFDAESGLHVPKALYYCVGSVQDTVKYTFSEAQSLAFKNQNAGPWNKYHLHLMDKQEKELSNFIKQL